MAKRIEPHEPEAELLDASEIAQDVAVLERALERKRFERLMAEVLAQDDIKQLVETIIDSGICTDEKEVIVRAVQTFFIAVAPEDKRSSLFAL